MLVELAVGDAYGAGFEYANPEIVRQGILRPGLSVVVDVDTRTSADTEKTASIKE